MSELVAVNIERVGAGDDWPAVLQIPYDITWPDLELMLTLHFDLDNPKITVLYIDEENDHISVNSNDELQEAFKVARKCGDVMNLKVLSPSEKAQYRTDNVAEILLDTRSQTVAMKTQPNPDCVTKDLTGSSDDDIRSDSSTSSNKCDMVKQGQVTGVKNEDNGEVVSEPLPIRDESYSGTVCVELPSYVEVQDQTEQEILDDISILEAPCMDQQVKTGAGACSQASIRSLEEPPQSNLPKYTSSDDVQSISSSSEDSLSMDGDFYMVPLPDCFHLDKPLTQSVCELKKEETAAATTNPDVVPLQFEDCVKEKEVQVVEDELHSYCEIEDLEETFQDTSEEIEVLEDEAMVVESLNKSADIQDDTPIVTDFDVEQNTMPQQYTDEENNNSQVGTEDQDITSVKTVEEDQLQACSSGSPTDVASNLIESAVNVASQAAAAAYSTAKDVFHTLQARNQYSPPKSEWQPKNQDWTPPKETWTPPCNNWKPPSNEWAPPQSSWTPTTANNEGNVDKHTTSMEQLIEMGFCNRSLNKELLQKHDDNIQLVIQELLSQEDNEWQTNRH